MTERFGNYEILRKIATGGMAEVLLAKQGGMGGFARLVCLKRILVHLSVQEDFLKMFQDEARIAANLIHPNIAQIYDIGTEDDIYYIAMEYVRGEDLRRVYNQEVAHKKTIPRHIAAQIIMGAAAGLDYAHRQTDLEGKPLGIVHRDISPQNIIVTYDGFVKVIDFGVAKAIGKLNETRSGVLKGKYSYMSPEQASGDAVDGRSDIFALGVTLYEITTGTRLFKRDNELETLHAVIACNVPPPHTLIDGYDAELETIILRALAYEPDARYQTAGEMEQDLERFLLSHGHSISASSLALYMHDLFAEKITDEVLFGGQPWNESATPSHLVKAHKAPVQHAAALNDMDTAPDLHGPNDWQIAADADIHNEDTASISHPHHTDIHTVVNAAKIIPESLPPSPSAIGPSPVEQEAPASYNKWWLVVVCIIGILLLDALWYKRYRAATLVTAQPNMPIGTSDLSQINHGQQQDVEHMQTDSLYGYLDITSPITLEVTLGNRRYVGDTPIEKLKLLPGNYLLQLVSKADGLLLRRNVYIRAGELSNIDITPHKGSLELFAKPWSWVQIGMRAPMETPLHLDLFEGEYTVLFECPDGRRRTSVVKIKAGETHQAAINCESTKF